MKYNSYYHAIMFDFDGTLVDTMHEYAMIAAQEMAVLYDLPLETARQLYMETSGIPFFQQLVTLFGDDSRNEICSNQFEARKALYLEGVRLSPLTISVLEEIRSMGLSIAITSNNFQYLLDRFIVGEKRLFDLVLGFGETYNKGPSQFTHVIDTFGVDRRYIVLVGDSISDARKALAFGIDFIAISGTVKPEAFTSLFPSVTVIDSLSELTDLLTHNRPIKGIR
jgi:beta-phosphoglucomutase-like phosphatase (HAD superfamily)